MRCASPVAGAEYRTTTFNLQADRLLRCGDRRAGSLLQLATTRESRKGNLRRGGVIKRVVHKWPSRWKIKKPALPGFLSLAHKGYNCNNAALIVAML